MNFAILSNINMEPLEAYLYKANIKNVTFSQYNQYLASLINENSFIYTTDRDYVFIHLDGEELLKEELFSLSLDKDRVFADIDQMLMAIENLIAKKNEVKVIISTVAFPPFSFNSYLENKCSGSLKDLEYEINQKLIGISNKYSNVLILDFARLIKLHGYQTIFDDKYWYLGRIKFADVGFQLIMQELESLLIGYTGKTKKVLVLDLDNTLWGGVIGEDGVNGIRISEDNTGKIYRDFQKAIKSLKQLGIILAINSKNNESDVKEVFEKCPMMVLAYDDFVIKKINWNDKITNMKEIALELNLGLDSFVFIDDNKIERELVKQHLSEVSVPAFPEDVAQVKRWFLSEVVYKYFPKTYLTQEDGQKTLQYHGYIQRKELREKLNMDDFINQLDIKLKIKRNAEQMKTRLAQLTQKTNQFNLTSVRYQEKDIGNFMKSPDSGVYSLEYEDKYGSEGIVGTAIVKHRGATLTIDTFLLSCRIIGRNVEYAFLYTILRHNNRGIKEVKGEYIPTKKNDAAKEFYPNCGLKEIQKDNFEGAIEETLSLLSKKISAEVLYDESTTNIG